MISLYHLDFFFVNDPFWKKGISYAIVKGVKRAKKAHSRAHDGDKLSYYLLFPPVELRAYVQYNKL